MYDLIFFPIFPIFQKKKIKIKNFYQPINGQACQKPINLIFSNQIGGKLVFFTGWFAVWIRLHKHKAVSA